MRVFSLIALGLALCVASGCATEAKRVDANYSAYLDFQREQSAQRLTATDIAQIAQSCKDDLCRVMVVQSAMPQRAGSAQVAPYQARESMAGKIGLALIGQLSPLAGAAVSWRQSDNAVQTTTAQYQFLGGVVSDVTAAAASMQPSVTVGGDYVTGSPIYDSGTHVGGDLVGGDQTHTGGDFITGHVGDAVGGDQAGGDQIGRDQINGDANHNSGRIDSDGPWQDVGNDNSTTTPPEADEGGGG